MSERRPRLAVFGAGGHGKVVLDAIARQGQADVVLVLDDNPATHNSPILGYRIAGGRECIATARDGIDAAIVAIGNNRIRLAVAAWLQEHGVPLHTVVHPAAVVAASARLDAGTLVMPGAIINADARIGANVIVNSGAIVEHDCVIDAGVHLAPGSVLCGNVTVGAATLIGAGAVVVPGVCIGANQLVKAGSLVKRNLESKP